MLSSGNGNAAICANNLVRISRGEVPYDRIKGVKLASLVGASSTEKDEIAEDTKWMVKTYEPRVSVEGVEVIEENAENGHIKIAVSISGG